MAALRGMMQYYEDYADEDDSTSVRLRREFGIKSTPQAPQTPVEDFDEDDGPIVPPESESLPEKALRVAGQRSAASTRRKSRLTGNE